MAKKSASTSEIGLEMGQYEIPTLASVWHDSDSHVTVPEALRYILSQLIDVPGLPSISTESGWHRDFCFAIIGEAGIAKTALIMKMCQENNLAFTRLEFAGTELADNLAVATPIEDPTRPGRYIHLVRGDMFFEPPSPTKKGIILINEGLAADARQQMQMRAFLSNRELLENRVHPGWTFVLDSNPVTQKYFTNKGLDHSLESRMWFIPVRGDVDNFIQFAGGYATDEIPLLPTKLKPVELTEGGFHAKLYKYLRVRGRDAGVYSCGHDRRWMMLSHLMTRMEAGGLVTQEQIARFMRLTMNSKIATDYLNFSSKGDNPKYYPILGSALVRADDKKHKQHMALVNDWSVSEDLQMMLGFTTLDVCDFLASLKDKELTKQEEDNLRDYMVAIPDDQTARICRARGSLNITKLFRLLTGTDKYNSVSKMVREASQSIGRY